MNKPAADLSAKELASQFNFPLREPLTEGAKMQAKEINRLFNAVKDERGLSEKQIFVDAVQKNGARDTRDPEQLLMAFLKDVTSCPKDVIRFCQETLSPRERR